MRGSGIDTASVLKQPLVLEGFKLYWIFNSLLLHGDDGSEKLQGLKWGTNKYFLYK